MLALAMLLLMMTVMMTTAAVGAAGSRPAGEMMLVEPEAIVNAPMNFQSGMFVGWGWLFSQLQELLIWLL